MPISFPGLFGDWSFNPDPIAVHIGHGIYWYGIILAIGLLAGLVLCMKQAKRYGLTEDNVLDMVLWAVPSCIIGENTRSVLKSTTVRPSAVSKQQSTTPWRRISSPAAAAGS